MRNKFTALLPFVSAIFFTSPIFAQSTYRPVYWLEGTTVYDRDMTATALADMHTMVDSAAGKGWNGLVYWGASPHGSKMHYYYHSPFLASKPWAVFERDGLSPLVQAAHRKGMKVMVNIEGVNPYHWQAHQWTPASIQAAATDLARAGADAVFEECFETNEPVFLSLARTLRQHKVNYLSGTDPMLLRESSFTRLWPETGTINLYNYNLKRDKLYAIATLAQQGSLGLGWAKYWNKPTSMVAPLDRDWGIDNDCAPAVVAYLSLIRALQFRLDHFVIFGGWKGYDPKQIDAWIQRYVAKQEERPTLNVVVLLGNGTQQPASEEAAWNRLFNSGDAITSGAFHGGYNVVVSDRVIPADAYYIYAPGGRGTDLPAAVVDLFKTDKKVLLQAAGELPSGKGLQPGWKTAYAHCGVDGLQAFQYAPGDDAPSKVSLPPDQENELPYTGYYKGRYVRFTGADVQRGRELRAGVIIPRTAISGDVLCEPNKTYGRGPFIIGNNNKYLITTTALGWEAAYPVADLLSNGQGVVSSSNVWGIAGKNVTALLAIEATELELRIPGLPDGVTIHVEIWDKHQQKKKEVDVVYTAPFKQVLSEYDLIVIDRVP